MTYELCREVFRACFAADSRQGLRVAGKEFVVGLFRRFGEVAEAVEADFQLSGGVAGLAARLLR